VKQSTYEGYRAAVNVHLTPASAATGFTF